MLEPKTLDDLAAKLNDAVPESLRTAQHDLEKTVRAGLQGAMQRLDIVSRDEFEVQSMLLARTREKLDAMEERVRALEAQLGIGGTNETEVPDDVHAED
ncbi:MAG: accessory factor UbiK family protein [Acidihalobacter sp.]|jgi:ubiquinone biosynthesis accessory factor UbiK|uniref:accessory factor UbiK family protein n=1 Tax=Acidihalobacter sp. TaxID=1872108 RepID=UPI00307FCCF0